MQLMECNPCTWGLRRNQVAGGPSAISSAQGWTSLLATEAAGKGQVKQRGGTQQASLGPHLHR